MQRRAFIIQGGAMVFAGIPVLVLAIVFALLFLFLFAGKSSARVVLTGSSFALSFNDVEADFAPAVESSGINGSLQVAQPLDACSPLMYKAKLGEGRRLAFALIKKGRCTFESKVRNAQAAGFSAAIIYNNLYGRDNLIEMSGNSEGITTHAVFISKEAGELLLKYNKYDNLECRITPDPHTNKLSDWSEVLIIFIGAFISLFVVTYVSDRIQQRIQRRRHIMGSKEVKALPSHIFTSPPDDKGTSKTCVVCLEDYIAGDKLRLLPCLHRFHEVCIDTWLTKWRAFCPVCKRYAKDRFQEPPASELTPLLSSAPLCSSNISSSGSRSTHSSPSGSSNFVTSSNRGSGAVSTHLFTLGSWVVNIDE